MVGLEKELLGLAQLPHQLVNQRTLLEREAGSGLDLPQLVEFVLGGPRVNRDPPRRR